MTRAAIPKNRIKEFIGSLMQEYRFVAPVREGTTLKFKVANNPDDVVLEDELAYMSPKEFLFPQTEQIMVFGKDGNVKVNNTTQKTVIFGIRPCDLEAVKVMTAVFTSGKYADTYFEKKLNDTILIGFGCKSMKKSCFCSERGIDKCYSKSCDIFIIENEEDFTAEVISQKGEQLLDKFQFEASQQEIPKNEPDPKDLIELNCDEKTLFEKIDWGRISEKCIECGACTYICPTCHCFAFRDVVENGDAIRYKCWDSCMYPKFTLHTSGHNPRASKKERYRQRVMHKYHYVKENFGYTACTGCGRCIRSCPAGMNIKSVVKDIMEEIR